MTANHLSRRAGPAPRAGGAASAPPAVTPPRIFGPARSGPLQRAVMLLTGSAFAGYMAWLVGTNLGQTGWAWPGIGGLSQGEKLLILIAAIAVVGAVAGSRAPFTSAIVEVSDTGVTTQMLGAAARPAAFVPFALLERVEVTPTRSDDILTITARAGAGRRWFQIPCTTRTGARAGEIAREIVRYARAAGVEVTGPEPGRVLAFESIWTFPAPQDSASGRSGGGSAGP
jgi:hypothetical protein